MSSSIQSNDDKKRAVEGMVPNLAAARTRYHTKISFLAPIVGTPEAA